MTILTQMSKTATRMDWTSWLRGGISSFVAAGSGAVSAAFGTVIVDWNDPDHYATNPSHLFYVGTICFLFSGLMALMTFLHNHPIPDPEPALSTEQKAT